MSNSPFFKTLPTEVRDIIYDYLWSDTKTVVQRYDTKDYKVTYDRRHDSLEAPPGSDKVPWLLTNKQIMREGTRQLHQKSTWHLDTRLLNGNVQSYIFDPITPSECHTHEIFIQCDWPMIFDDQKRVYRLSEVARAEINASAATANVSTPLDTVCIKIVRPTNERLAANSAPDFTFDLSHLEILSRHTELRRLQLHLVGGIDDTKKLVSNWSLEGETDSADRARRLEDQYLDAWKKEISLVAQLVILRSKRSGYMREFTWGNDGERCLEWVWTFEKQGSSL
ncbi:hypothetical protein BKA58DRAFT_447720 [Alternaria rosae]|uniref:uncharacterized protein n=1 Tax=Alternaria rosae TaxID=1187941 RepID=UPI001E8D97D0|nr:uncharacterized protein BKA58DRAFT_447720 [Alternaria rosae]KAH6883005.1 hypothetical protein BKA58DRAFT_447720 [Alternaria rosae]